MSGKVDTIGSKNGIIGVTQQIPSYTGLNMAGMDENLGNSGQMWSSCVDYYDARSGTDSNNRWYAIGGSNRYLTMTNSTWHREWPTYWRLGGISEASRGAFNASPRNSYACSIMAWVYNDYELQGTTHEEIVNMSIAGQRVSVGKGYWNSTYNGLSLMYGGTGHWVIPTSTMGGTFPGWNHIVWNISGSNSGSSGCYINGEWYQMTSMGGAHGGSAGWMFGSNASGTSESWQGKVGEFWIFSTTLNGSQSRYFFNQGRARYQNPKYNFRQY